MVRRQYNHNGVGRPPLDMERGKTYAGSSISAERFDDDVLSRDTGHLPHQLIGMALTRNNQNILFGDKRRDPLDRFLDNSPCRDYIQQMLWHPLSALRPEAGAFATRHNHCVHYSLRYQSLASSSAGAPLEQRTKRTGDYQRKSALKRSRNPANARDQICQAF
jgi:hypothetical protein